MAVSTARMSSEQVAVLVEDPDLALGIPEDERQAAERVVIVPEIVAPAGPLDLEGQMEEPALGAILLSGFVHARVTLGERAASQIVGPGDVLHAVTMPAAVLPATLGYEVAEDARLAVLDRRFIAAVRRWPGMLLAVHERLRAQEHRLAVHAAIAKARRVEDRVLAVLWQLAEHWGRVSPEGIVVPIALTHETIGRLAGAARPTVSLALAALTEEGAITCRRQGALVLAPDSWERLRSLHQRRVPRAPARPVQRPGAPIDPERLRQRIAALHENFSESARNVDDTLAAARTTAERSRATRQQVAELRRTALSH